MKQKDRTMVRELPIPQTRRSAPPFRASIETRSLRDWSSDVCSSAVRRRRARVSGGDPAEARLADGARGVAGGAAGGRALRGGGGGGARRPRAQLRGGARPLRSLEGAREPAR